MKTRPLNKFEVIRLREVCKRYGISIYCKVGSAKYSPTYVGRQCKPINEPVRAIQILREHGFHIDSISDELAAKGLLDVILVTKEA